MADLYSSSSESDNEEFDKKVEELKNLISEHRKKLA
jgi:hypothetical protein